MSQENQPWLSVSVNWCKTLLQEFVLLRALSPVKLCVCNTEVKHPPVRSIPGEHGGQDFQSDSFIQPPNIPLRIYMGQVLLKYIAPHQYANFPSLYQNHKPLSNISPI